MERLLSRREVAELAGVGPRTIDRWRKGFRGAALRTRQRGGAVAFTEGDLQAFFDELERRREAAGQKPPKARLTAGERRWLGERGVAV